MLAQSAQVRTFCAYKNIVDNIHICELLQHYALLSGSAPFVHMSH